MERGWSGTHVHGHGVGAGQRGDAGHEVGRDEGAQHERALARGRAHGRVALEVHRDQHHRHLRDAAHAAARHQHLHTARTLPVTAALLT